MGYSINYVILLAVNSVISGKLFKFSYWSLFKSEIKIFDLNKKSQRIKSSLTWDVEKREKSRFKRNKIEFQKYHIWDAECYERKGVEWAFGYVNWELGEEYRLKMQIWESWCMNDT